MSTDYYVVCDQCKESYWAWRRTAGGVNSPPIADDPDDFQAFLSRHLHNHHPLRFVSEDDSDSLGYKSVHPAAKRSETIDNLEALADQYEDIAAGRKTGFACDPAAAAAVLRAAAELISSR